MINIDVISEEIIKPSKPTPSHLHKLPSSLFDHVNIPILMPIVFFYSPKKPPTNSAVLHNLKASLPATLTVFYPLAGRVQDVNHIACNDEGVPFVQAQVSSICLGDVVHKADISQLDKLVPPHGNEGYTKLLLVIQLTSFACGGVAIGLKTSHAICDAFSVAMFIKTWAELAKGEIHHPRLISPCPFFDIWKVFPPHPSKIGTNSDVPTEPDPEFIAGKKPVTKWFLFRKADCDALRSRLWSSKDIDYTTTSLTLVLSAFISNRIKIARSSGRDVRNNNVPHEVYHAVNIRPKVKTPLVDDKSCYYFGNMVVNALATLKNDNFIVDMKESIDKITGKSGSSSFIQDLQEQKQDLNFMIEHFERHGRGELVSLGFTALRSLPMYESDFGWGKPVWVTTLTPLFTGLVILLPAGPSSKDTIAYVSLTGDEMAKLEADREFMSIVSKSATTFASKSKL